MWRALLRQPDAVALILLISLVAGTLVLGLVLGRRRDGRRAGAPPTSMETTWPALVKKELLAAMITLLLVTWWAMAQSPELGPPADPELTPAMAKAPWFFVGVQEMLQYFDPWLAGAVLPLLVIVGLIALPYLDVGEGQGDYTLRERPVVLALTLALVLLWLGPMIVGQLLRNEHWIFYPAWLPAPLEPPAPQPMTSVAELLGLGAAGGQLLGGAICLGPFLLLPLGWRLLGSRAWARPMGWARFHLAGALLITLALVVIKIALVVALDVRYLWVTPWVRI